MRDLLGVEFNANEEFPPDDSGYGFDNISDVLTVLPVLMQRYLTAARCDVVFKGNVGTLKPTAAPSRSNCRSIL